VKLKIRSNRPRIRSWEADPDVAKLLDLAVLTTGASIKSIVSEAIRTHGPAIIRRLLAEREGPRRELEAILAANAHESIYLGKSKNPTIKTFESKK